MSVLVLLAMVVLGAMVVVVFLARVGAFGSERPDTSAAAREAHRRDGESHIYYYSRGGFLVHESESCCMGIAILVICSKRGARCLVVSSNQDRPMIQR